MRYLSVCSGIEAATVAWHPLGWSPVAFAEIEAFPSAVLAHHYPDVRNWGDITKFKDWPDADVDVLVGGTPCQSFSVAGLRQGLADPRGNLALVYLAIADRYRPEWLVWENVPGVLSSEGGRDFGSIIGGMVELGYSPSWRVLDAQYVRVDGFARAVPQRRRRVFVVGHLGDWRRSAAVLFERESLQGDTAPRRQAGQGLAPTISARPTGGGGLGTDFDCDGGLIASAVASVDATNNIDRGDSQHLERLVAHALRADGFDAGEDGTGRGTPIVPVDITNCLFGDGVSGTLEHAQYKGTRGQGVLAPSIARTLTRGAESRGKGGYAGRRQEDDANLVAAPFTLAIRGRSDGHQLEARQDGTANAVLTPNGGRAGIGVGAIAFAHQQGGSIDLHMAKNVGLALQRHQQQAVAQSWAVRRLTPRECERLQGFPDGYTDVPYRGKRAADGPRYKALGNSMACNVMRWVGSRIQMVSEISAEAA